MTLGHDSAVARNWSYSPVPRRILLLITDLEIGGTPTVVRELAIRLNRPPEVIVDVACLSRGGPVSEQLRSRGISVTTLDAKGPTDLSTLPRLIRLIRGQHDPGYDTVFSFLIHANVMAAAASLVCRRARFLQSIQTTQPEPGWHWWLQSIVHYAADTIVVPSESVAQMAYERCGIPREKVAVIPNAVEISAADELKLSGPNDPPRGQRIGFLGRLDPIKRIPDLIQAMRFLDPPARLEIFGRGPQRAELEEMIVAEGMSDRICLHGVVADPGEALAQMDLLVLPSAAEGFGLVLIEAMNVGVPVIGTDVPGIRDVVRDQVTGLLVPVASPAAIAAAVRRVWDEPALAARLVAAARQDIAARFSWHVVLPRYQRLLKINGTASALTAEPGPD